MLNRIHYLFISLSICLLLLGGCAKKATPPMAPEVMSEGYLMKNMQTLYIPDLNLTAIYTIDYTQHKQIKDSNITLETFLVALVPNSAQNSLKDSTIQIRFTQYGSSWSNFKSALDTAGNSLYIKPTTSTIRDGRYTENFIIEITQEQLETYADEGVDFLLLSKDKELLISIPSIYFGALYRYLL